MANTLDLKAAALDITQAANAAAAASPHMAMMAAAMPAGAVGAAAPAAATAAGFCTVWAEAKPVLQGALVFLALFPRIRAVAERLIAIGDQIAAAAGCK